MESLLSSKDLFPGSIFLLTKTGSAHHNCNLDTYNVLTVKAGTWNRSWILRNLIFIQALCSLLQPTKATIYLTWLHIASKLDPSPAESTMFPFLRKTSLGNWPQGRNGCCGEGERWWKLYTILRSSSETSTSSSLDDEHQIIRRYMCRRGRFVWMWLKIKDVCMDNYINYSKARPHCIIIVLCGGLHTNQCTLAQPPLLPT